MTRIRSLPAALVLAVLAAGTLRATGAAPGAPRTVVELTKMWIAAGPDRLLVQDSRQKRECGGRLLFLADEFDAGGRRLGEVAFVTDPGEGAGEIMVASRRAVLALRQVRPDGRPAVDALDCDDCSPAYSCYRVAPRPGAAR